MAETIGFDPFTATLEEAQAQSDADAIHGSVMRWGGACMLEQGRKHYEANPLEGVSWCAIHGLVMPDWLARSFLNAYRKVLRCDVSTWDKAFGPAFPKSSKLPQLKAKRKNRIKVWNAVNNRLLREPETSINRMLFDEVGEEIGISGSGAERLYYEARGLLDADRLAANPEQTLKF